MTELGSPRGRAWDRMGVGKRFLRVVVPGSVVREWGMWQAGKRGKPIGHCGSWGSTLRRSPDRLYRHILPLRNKERLWNLHPIGWGHWHWCVQAITCTHSWSQAWSHGQRTCSGRCHRKPANHPGMLFRHPGRGREKMSGYLGERSIENRSISYKMEKMEVTWMFMWVGGLYKFWCVCSMKYCPVLFCPIMFLCARFHTKSQHHCDEKDRTWSLPPQGPRSPLFMWDLKKPWVCGTRLFTQQGLHSVFWNG